MSDEANSQILTALSDLKLGQANITKKVNRCESVLYGREEDNKPGLGERVRRIEETLASLNPDDGELWAKYNALDKQLTELRARHSMMVKAVTVLGGTLVTVVGRIVFVAITA